MEAASIHREGRSRGGGDRDWRLSALRDAADHLRRDVHPGRVGSAECERGADAKSATDRHRPIDPPSRRGRRRTGSVSRAGAQSGAGSFIGVTNMSELLFYMHDGPKTFRFELSGNLAGVEVGKLDQAWRTASSTFDDKVLAVDITFLTGVDEKGRDLLVRWSQAGAHLVANSDASRK